MLVHTHRHRLFSLLFWFMISEGAMLAQSQARFESEIIAYLKQDDSVHLKKPILFTGSSTIRMWNKLEEDFSGYPILNRGFGGSTAEDLLYRYEVLIKKHRPAKIFIYEGDNDIASGQSPDQVVKIFEQILTRIHKDLKKADVYLISPKPSPSRWHLRNDYLSLNVKLKVLASHYKRITFVDMWQPMLDAQGQPRPELFLKDQLHMNQAGYSIWKKVLALYLPPKS